MRLRIDPKTLRRRYVITCRDCVDEVTRSQEQLRLRDRRRRKDWDEITTPVRTEAIVRDKMPEQYPGRVRDALRAFMASDATRAIVPGIDVASLQESIASLGLHNEIYAEQRDDQTVIRRIAKKREDLISA